MVSGPLFRFLAVFGLSSLASWMLVGLLREYALRRQILDKPSLRTSHSRPTPRGGGPGVVVALLGAGISAVYAEGRDWPLVLALCGLGVVTGVGWADDRRSLAVMPRLAAHLIAAALIVPLALTLPTTAGLATGLAVGWWVFWAVSSINVVNFMDGIDGLIGAQMVVFGIHLALQAGGGPEAVMFAAGLAGSALGFLWWNWTPAKIFMGDSGSGALGLACVAGGLLVLRGTASLVVTFLPLYPIFLDATVTLALRVRRGERITEAHREHLYQRMANGGLGHAPVSLLYAVAAASALPVALLPPGWQSPGIAAYAVAVALAGLILSSRFS